MTKRRQISAADGKTQTSCARRVTRRRLLSPLSLVAAVALGGCNSVGPDFAPPDPALPRVSFFGKPQPIAPDFAQPVAPLDPEWWRQLHDPTLSGLIARAASNNLDVRTATTRLLESRAQRDTALSAAFPTANLDPSYQREQYSQNGIVKLASELSGSTTTTPPHVPPISVWNFPLDASWEVDIWGKVRRQVEAAEAQVTSLEYQRRDTLVSTVAEIANDYIQLRGVEAQIAITKENAASADDILQLTRTRAAKGVTTGLDVENAAQQVEAVRAQLPSLENQRSALLSAIGVLLDQPPGEMRAEIARTAALPPTPPAAPLGVASDLARRRPDIRRAEADLHAATANIGVAVADFYPSVKLNGSVGLNSLDLKTLFKASSLQYQFGPSVSLPVFDGGRLRSTLQLREAQQQEAAIAYHKTVLSAWHEVVDALVAYRTEQQRRERLRAQGRHAREALTLSRARYLNGVADFIVVLDAERTLLQAQLQLAQSATIVGTNFVRLYKALGGGWEEAFPLRPEGTFLSPPPPAPPPPPPDGAVIVEQGEGLSRP